MDVDVLVLVLVDAIVVGGAADGAGVGGAT